MASREEEERERIKKLVEEELAARKKLADLQKSMNQDIATYLQQNLNILEGVRKIKELEDEINELKQEGGEVNEEIVKQREDLPMMVSQRKSGSPERRPAVQQQVRRVSF